VRYPGTGNEGRCDVVADVVWDNGQEVCWSGHELAPGPVQAAAKPAASHSYPLTWLEGGIPGFDNDADAVLAADTRQVLAVGGRMVARAEGVVERVDPHRSHPEENLAVAWRRHRQLNEAVFFIAAEGAVLKGFHGSLLEEAARRVRGCLLSKARAASSW
jgi:hypothetical protein